MRRVERVDWESVEGFWASAFGRHPEVKAPFPFQKRFAKTLSPLVRVPTGLGKTAMAVLGWVWRRIAAPREIRSQTPRRLVYCLPTRVLVEQTRDNAVQWLYNLGLLGGEIEFESDCGQGTGTAQHESGQARVKSYKPSAEDPDKIPVYVLMGGEEEEDWDLYPERAAVIIGTQDMLLSRALNRGYAASRSRWPMQFGLLNTDCLWVFDEVQLMGSGLATTAQLEAFRKRWAGKDGYGPNGSNGCLSVWMSATLDPAWLETVDFDPVALGAPLQLSEDDLRLELIQTRVNAVKTLEFTHARVGDSEGLASEVLKEHIPGGRTLVVLNTVKRAREFYRALVGGRRRAPDDDVCPVCTRNGARVVLLHSRFRPQDRQRQLALAMAEPTAARTIIISTQVIEAGVDLDAHVLFTELAPWPALVQRFGRCNRRGNVPGAKVFVIDLPGRKKDADEFALPYTREELEMAREYLDQFKGGSVAPAELEKAMSRLGAEQRSQLFKFEHEYVLRYKDLIELFDTTPDLAGNDLDIDRFVRAVDESDVFVFWRDYGDPRNASPNASPRAAGGVEPAPARDELCPVPFAELRNFAGAKERRRLIWRWDFLERRWERVERDRVFPGQVYLVHASAGGYEKWIGWDPTLEHTVEALQAYSGEPDSTESETFSHAGAWQTVAEHAERVIKTLGEILDQLQLKEHDRRALLLAARWHDRGKAHAAFISKLNPGKLQCGDAIRCLTPPNALGKAPADCWRDHGSRAEDDPNYRKYFRHELASALAVLTASESLIPAELRDLVAYLVAAHHGKVRLSIRSLPEEKVPDRKRPDGQPVRFARGVWDGDELPETDLGGGVLAPAVRLSLEPMELGLCEEEPFQGQPSWLERMLRLRDLHGPFRLAYLEALLRAADMRVSKANLTNNGGSGAG